MAMLFSWFFIMLNPGISPGETVGAEKYLVFISSALSTIFRSLFVSSISGVDGVTLRKETFSLILVLFLVVIHSLVLSYYPILSSLKAIIFVVVFCTIFSAWSSLSPEQRVSLRLEILLFLCSVIFISLFLLGSPVGYLANGSGFQGILNQPQVFGVTVALASIMIFPRIFNKRKNLRWWLIISIFSVLIFLSEARIAGFSVFFAVVSTILIFMFKSRRRINVEFRGLGSSSSTFVIVLLAVIVSVNFSFITSEASQYFSKGGRDGDVENIAEAFIESRGFLMLRMFNNIVEHPFLGIGFGVDSFPETMAIVVDPVLGVPISAPVEKGVLPLAIIEEFGMVMGGVIFIFLFMALCRGYRAGLWGMSLVFFTYFVNMGEAMLFSPGGMGLLVITIFCGVLASWRDGKKI